jgi:acetate---CoA ligase (ADP-forming)
MAEVTDRVAEPLGRALLERFLNPRSVAIVGASANTLGMAGRAWVNLTETGWGGRLHLVNPTRDRIGPHPAVPSVGAIGEEVDAAIILVRAAVVEEAVAACVDAGIGAITVCTSGFSELGAEGRARQESFAATVRAGGARMLGPNCIGVLNVVDGYVAVPTYNVTRAYTPGGVTMLSHSGGMAVNLFNRAQGRGIGIRALVTLGNEADIDMAEMVEALVEDEHTRVVALFCERLIDGDRFVRAARLAHASGKPVVVLKAGRSEVGRRSVAGHTGTLAGEAEVYSGVFAQTGVLEVETLDGLLNAAHVLDVLDRPAGPRLGVFTVSGGEAAYFADRATPAGLEFPPLSPATADALKELVRFGVPGNPFDATGQIIGNPDYVRAAVEAFCADEAFDALALVTATWGAPDAESLLPHLIDAAGAAPVPAVIASWSAHNLTERARELLGGSDVPVFETSDEAIAALAALVRWWQGTGHVGQGAGAAAAAVERPDAPPGVLDEHRAKRVLRAAGLPVAAEVLAADHDAVLAALGQLRRPVVLKGLARDVLHKSDLGLVRLGLDSVERLRAALRAVDEAAAAHDCTLDGYLVAEQAFGVEMIVGSVVDPTFGPVVLVGAGGVLAEHRRDVAFLLAPATEAEVAAALRRLGAWPVLEGLRGAEPDVASLVAFVQRFSVLAAGAAGWLEMCDVNPVVVRGRGEGVVAVDAAMVLR